MPQPFNYALKLSRVSTVNVVDKQFTSFDIAVGETLLHIPMASVSEIR